MRVKLPLFVLACLLSLGAPAAAQTVVTGPVIIEWDQTPVAGVSVLPSAFTFDVGVDGAAPAPAAATCTAPTAPATDWVCRTSQPLDLSEGKHVVVVVAKATVAGTAYASGPSAPLEVMRVTITITVPKNVRIAAAGGGE